MNLSLRPTRQSRSGNTLVVTMITMAVVGVFIDLSLQYTTSIGRNVQRSLLLRQAINVGDASTEMAFAAWRTICRANENTVLKGSSFSAVPSPSPGNIPGVKYTLVNYKIYPLDSYWQQQAVGSTPPPIAGPNHGDLSFYYLAGADVVIPTIESKNPTSLTDKNNIVAKVRRVFQKEILSLWRYAIFFVDDMEIHPGPAMTINGDVHTNGSLYTGHNSLTLNGKTTYVDSWSIGFMPGDSQHPETPTSPNWATGLPPASDQAQLPFGVSMPDYHELIEPLTDDTDALDSYRFEQQADYRVMIDASNNVKVYDSKGKDVTSKKGGTDIAAAITTNQTITDKREGATTGNASVRLATVDVGAITTAVNNGNLGNFNGILYITDTSADPNGVTAKRGIRLKNGGKLPDGSRSGTTTGLTIVSGNPVYVQGDYNTGTVGATQPLSNSGDPTQPTVAGYTRQPAAIVADAVNILSNSWVDSASGTMPLASATTVNAGIVSGSVVSGGGYYSGGVENFPRFLENWSGQTLTYYGSMIELYQSKQAIGHWGAPGVYNPPNRAWYFDTSFVSKPPPGLLVSYNYRRSRWYMQ